MKALGKGPWALLEIVFFLGGFVIGVVINTIRFLYFLIFEWQIGGKK